MGCWASTPAWRVRSDDEAAAGSAAAAVVAGVEAVVVADDDAEGDAAGPDCGAGLCCHAGHSVHSPFLTCYVTL